MEFKEEALRFGQNSRPETVSLTHLLLKLHDGSIFGFAGRLFVDLIGVAMIFLTLSGLYYWASLYSGKRSVAAITARKWCYRQHLNVGFYSIFFITLITLSGILIRPPSSALKSDQTSRATAGTLQPRRAVASTARQSGLSQRHRSTLAGDPQRYFHC